MSQTPRIIDLSHPIEHGMVTYPGLPSPQISDHLSREASDGKYAPGTQFQIGTISMVANTGTYLDAPFHRYADGADLADLPLERLVNVPGVCIDATGGERAIGPEHFEGLEAHIEGHAVILNTGWSKHWGTLSYGNTAHPFLTQAATAWLAERNPAFVGIDSVNIDDMADLTRPAHTGLLGAQVPVVEHLTNLSALPPTGFVMHVAPPAVRAMGTFTVRAYAIVTG